MVPLWRRNLVTGTYEYQSAEDWHWYPCDASYVLFLHRNGGRKASNVLP